jgi:hypothetical protein
MLFAKLPAANLMVSMRITSMENASCPKSQIDVHSRTHSSLVTRTARAVRAKSVSAQGNAYRIV